MYNSRIPEKAFPVILIIIIIIESTSHQKRKNYHRIDVSSENQKSSSNLRGISKTSSVHFTQLPVSNMKFPYGITSYWTLMIYLEWTFKVYLCVAGFSYVRTCIRSPCKFGTRCVYAPDWLYENLNNPCQDPGQLNDSTLDLTKTPKFPPPYVTSMRRWWSGFVQDLPKVVVT